MRPENLRYGPPSPIHGSPGAGISRTIYDQLKQQVQQLKVEQREAHETKAQQRELETAALLQQKMQYEEQLQVQQQELAWLQLRLKDIGDRPAKVRQHADKDKKALTQQLEKLQQALDQAAHSHGQVLAARDAAHLQQLQEVRDTLCQRQEEWANERRALQAKQAQFMSEVEEWSQGEVEAIQAAAAARLQHEQEVAAHWQEQCQLARVLLQDAQQQISGLQEQLHLQQQTGDAEARQHVASASVLQQQLDAAEQKLLAKQQQLAQEQQRWQQQLGLLQREHEARESQEKARHTLELDAVHAKLQGVLQKKDHSIASLRAQLAAATLRLQQRETELLELQEECEQ